MLSLTQPTYIVWYSTLESSLLPQPASTPDPSSSKKLQSIQLAMATPTQVYAPQVPLAHFPNHLSPPAAAMPCVAALHHRHAASHASCRWWPGTGSPPAPTFPP
jgi:hypothetical protein